MTLLEARDEATRRFLGHGDVLGVGIKGPNGPLVMLMQRRSEQEQAKIMTWANARRIAVEFVVTGRIVSANL
jgi:hypothetical protein